MTQLFPKGKCITFLLSRLGTPATEISKITNTNITYLSHMINGTRKVTPEVQSAIYAVFGFNPWA